MTNYIESVKKKWHDFVSSNADDDTESSSEPPIEEEGTSSEGLWHRCKRLADEANTAIKEAQTAISAIREILKEIGPIATAVTQINQLIEEKQYVKTLQQSGLEGAERIRQLGSFRKFMLRKITGLSDEEAEKIGQILGQANAAYDIFLLDDKLKELASQIHQRSINVSQILSEKYDTEKQDNHPR